MPYEQPRKSIGVEVWVVLGVVVAGGLLLGCGLLFMVMSSVVARNDAAFEGQKRASPVPRPAHTTTVPVDHSTTTIPDNVTFTIISEEKTPGVKRTLEVRLNRQISQDALRLVAMKLRASDPNEYRRTFIGYYLPDMRVGAGGWATTHFNPDLEVKILNLQLYPEPRRRPGTYQPIHRENSTSQQQLVDRFMGGFPDNGIDPTFVVAAFVQFGCEPDDTARITMSENWQVGTEEQRLQSANALWKAWASIVAPEDLERARIKLVDAEDNEVGGSLGESGSNMWVQDEQDRLNPP